jgi:hypothetical protein
MPVCLCRSAVAKTSYMLRVCVNDICLYMAASSCVAVLCVCCCAASSCDCFNGGTCLAAVNATGDVTVRTCLCPDNYTGDTCEFSSYTGENTPILLSCIQAISASRVQLCLSHSTVGFVELAMRTLPV